MLKNTIVAILIVLLCVSCDRTISRGTEGDSVIGTDANTASDSGTDSTAQTDANTESDSRTDSTAQTDVKTESDSGTDSTAQTDVKTESDSGTDSTAQTDTKTDDQSDSGTEPGPDSTKDSGGESDTETKPDSSDTVVVPTLTVSITTDEPVILNGQSTDLSVTITGGVPPADKCLWNDQAGSTNCNKITVSPTEKTTYKITVTDAEGNTASAEIDIDVKTLTATAPDVVRVCSVPNASVKIVGVADGGIGQTECDWFQDGKPIAEKTCTLETSEIKSNTKVTLKVTDSKGNSHSKEISVEFGQPMTIGSYTQSHIILLGESVKFNAGALVTGGFDPRSCAYSDGKTGCGEVELTPAVDTTYEVTVNDSACPEVKASFEVKVFKTPVLRPILDLYISDNTAPEIPFKIDNGGHPELNCEYKKTGDTTPTTIACKEGEDNKLVLPTVTDDIEVTLDVKIGDTIVASSTFQVIVLEVEVSADKTDIDVGEEVTLTVTVRGTRNPPVCQWRAKGSEMIIAENDCSQPVVVTPKIYTTYEVTVIDGPELQREHAESVLIKVKMVLNPVASKLYLPEFSGGTALEVDVPMTFTWSGGNLGTNGTGRYKCQIISGGYYYDGSCGRADDPGLTFSIKMKNIGQTFLFVLKDASGTVLTKSFKLKPFHASMTSTPNWPRLVDVNDPVTLRIRGSGSTSTSCLVTDNHGNTHFDGDCTLSASTGVTLTLNLNKTTTFTWKATDKPSGIFRTDSLTFAVGFSIFPIDDIYTDSSTTSSEVSPTFAGGDGNYTCEYYDLSNPSTPFKTIADTCQSEHKQQLPAGKWRFVLKDSTAQKTEILFTIHQLSVSISPDASAGVINATVDGYEDESALKCQWKQAATINGPFANIDGATDCNRLDIDATQSLFYQLQVEEPTHGTLATDTTSALVAGLCTDGQKSGTQTDVDCGGRLAWFNEIHYDDVGVTNDPGFEIAAPAGLSLDGWKVYIYNEDGTIYKIKTLSGTIAEEKKRIGAIWFAQSLPDTGAGLQLVDNHYRPLEFISYKVSVTGKEGPAKGVKSRKIGPEEDDTSVAGTSIQRFGNPLDANNNINFKWTGGLPATQNKLNVDGSTLQSAGLGFPMCGTCTTGKTCASHVDCPDTDSCSAGKCVAGIITDSDFDGVLDSADKCPGYDDAKCQTLCGGRPYCLIIEVDRDASFSSFDTNDCLENGSPDKVPWKCGYFGEYRHHRFTVGISFDKFRDDYPSCYDGDVVYYFLSPGTAKWVYAPVPGTIENGPPDLDPNPGDFGTEMLNHIANAEYWFRINQPTQWLKPTFTTIGPEGPFVPHAGTCWGMDVQLPKMKRHPDLNFETLRPFAGSRQQVQFSTGPCQSHNKQNMTYKAKLFLICPSGKDSEGNSFCKSNFNSGQCGYPPP